MRNLRSRPIGGASGLVLPRIGRFHILALRCSSGVVIFAYPGCTMSDNLSPEDYASLEQAAYEAAVIPELWPNVLARLGEISESAGLTTTRSGASRSPARDECTLRSATTGVGWSNSNDSLEPTLSLKTTSPGQVSEQEHRGHDRQHHSPPPHFTPYGCLPRSHWVADPRGKSGRSYSDLISCAAKLAPRVSIDAPLSC